MANRSNMKLPQVLAGIFTVIIIGNCAPAAGADAAHSPPPQFILINREPRQPWNIEDPDSFQRGQFEEIQHALPTPKEARVRVGMSFIFSYLVVPEEGSE